MTISTDRTVNINLSDVVLQNLIDVFKAWNNMQDEKKEVSDDLFNQIEQYQNKEVSKYSVDDVLYQNRNKRGTELDKTAQNIENDDDDLVAPVSITNLTGVSLKIHKIEDEKVEDEFAFSNTKEPGKVYQPIRLEFERDHFPIEHLELSKLHSGVHQLTEEGEDIVFYGVHLNKMQKMLTVRTYYTIHNQTIFTYVLRVYNETMDEYIINPDQKLPILKNIQDRKCSI